MSLCCHADNDTGSSRTPCVPALVCGTVETAFQTCSLSQHSLLEVGPREHLAQQVRASVLVWRLQPGFCDIQNALICPWAHETADTFPTDCGSKEIVGLGIREFLRDIPAPDHKLLKVALVGVNPTCLRAAPSRSPSTCWSGNDIPDLTILPESELRLSRGSRQIRWQLLLGGGAPVSSRASQGHVFHFITDVGFPKPGQKIICLCFQRPHCATSDSAVVGTIGIPTRQRAPLQCREVSLWKSRVGDPRSRGFSRSCTASRSGAKLRYLIRFINCVCSPLRLRVSSPYANG